MSPVSTGTFFKYEWKNEGIKEWKKEMFVMKQII